MRRSSFPTASELSEAVTSFARERSTALARALARLGSTRGATLLRRRSWQLEHALRPVNEIVPAGDAFESTGTDPQFLVARKQRWAPGHYLMFVHVVPEGKRGYAKLYVDTGRGFREEESFGLVTRSDKAVFRFVSFDRTVRRIRLDPQDRPGRFELRAFRLARVPRAFAERRMRKRLGDAHASFRGLAPAAIDAIIDVRAKAEGHSARDELLRAYDETFQGGIRHTGYRTWRAVVEDADDALLDRDAPALVASFGTDAPRISVVVPTYETEAAHLEACLESVLAQSYPHWELCVADDASTAPHVGAILDRFAARDGRIRIHRRTTRGHISLASNDALALATGTYVALLDHDDVLPRHALLHVARTLVERPETVLLYGDEDKLDALGRRRQPHFKPEWNPELALAQNYVGHLLVARTDRVREVGGFRPGFEGSQDHDLVLRLVEGVDRTKIVHVPRILYHWRAIEGSTAAYEGAKGYAAEAGRRAVQEALVRRGSTATVEHAADVAHGYRVRWPVPEPAPLVSIIVPTRDGVDLLRVCIESVLAKTDYRAFEILVVDNGSEKPETHAYLERTARDPRVRVLRHPRPFNFSEINNVAVAEARGDVVALLNNDIEVVEGGWLGEMVSHALRPEIGCVGAKLLYPNDTIQHAGVIVGLGGVAGHSHKYFPKDHPGYFNRLRLAHALSAVTAACLVVRKRVYEEMGGLDTGFAVAFNDVDFCLRVRDAGYRNVFTPYATLYHHESATRGAESSPEKYARFRGEVDRMRARWGDALLCDPYYSPHLTLDHENFGIGIRR